VARCPGVVDHLPQHSNTWGTGWIKIGTYKGEPLSLQQLTLSFQGSLLFMAAGSLMSIRQAWSMLLGAVINYAVLAPIMLNAGVIPTPSFGRSRRGASGSGCR